VLPEDGDEDEDGGDKDEREGDLGDGSGGERLDVDVGPGAGVVLFVPAGEGGEEEEGDEGEDDGDDAGSSVSSRVWANRGGRAYSRYGNTTASLNVVATQTRLSGSWSMETCSASAVALFEQRNAPSVLTQRPKYPTRTSSCACPTMLAIAAVTPGSTCVGS